MVLGIPRGGVVTAKNISKILDLPLGVIITRKITAPSQPELAIGAVGPNGTAIFDTNLINELKVDETWIKSEVNIKRREVKEREKKFRRGSSVPISLNGKTVILVDDGVATGYTVEAAIKYLKTRRLKKLILAIPVAPRDTISRLRRQVDKLIVLEIPVSFHAVGQFYHSFPQVSDQEVIQLLQ